MNGDNNGNNNGDNDGGNDESGPTVLQEESEFVEEGLIFLSDKMAASRVEQGLRTQILQTVHRQLLHSNYSTVKKLREKIKRLCLSEQKAQQVMNWIDDKMATFSFGGVRSGLNSRDWESCGYCCEAPNELKARPQSTQLRKVMAGEWDAFRLREVNRMTTGGFAIDRSKKLGNGAYGCVYADKFNPELAYKIQAHRLGDAFKEVNVGSMLQVFWAAARIEEEGVAWNKCSDSPFVLNLIACITLENATILVMKRCKSSLHAYIVLHMDSNNALCDRTVLQNIFNQLLLALAHIHKKRLLHRDLKPENILVDEPNGDAWIQVADFGSARTISDDQEGSVAGTKLYCAPECMVQGYVPGPGVDMRAAAMTMVALFLGFAHKNHPFPGDYPGNWLDKVQDGHADAVVKALVAIDPIFASLVGPMLSFNPYGRPQSALAVLDHEFFRDYLRVRCLNQADPICREWTKLKHGHQTAMAAMYDTNPDIPPIPIHVPRKELANELLGHAKRGDMYMMPVYTIATFLDKEFQNIFGDDDGDDASVNCSIPEYGSERFEGGTRSKYSMDFTAPKNWAKDMLAILRKGKDTNEEKKLKKEEMAQRAAWMDKALSIFQKLHQNFQLFLNARSFYDGPLIFQLVRNLVENVFTTELTPLLQEGVEVATAQASWKSVVDTLSNLVWVHILENPDKYLSP